MKSTFIQSGNWYKGNLHGHSTVSDGRLTPEQVREEYKKKRYNFIVHSEHDIYTDYQFANEPEFITIPGFEASIPTPDNDYRIYHLNVFLGTDEMIEQATLPLFQHFEKTPIKKWEGLQTVQEFINEMNSRGCMVMFNHPHWSTIELEDIIELENLFGMEVYNHCSQWLENMGESNILWETLLRRGKKLWGTATDDNHNGFPVDSAKCDSFGGWIVVKAEELTRNSIMNAILKGSFYASTGPSIYDFKVDNNEVIFKCSPVQRIYLNGDLRQYQIEISETGEDTLTEFRKPLRGDEKFLRIECIDKYGKKAYTNPIYLD